MISVTNNGVIGGVVLKAFTAQALTACLMFHIYFLTVSAELLPHTSEDVLCHLLCHPVVDNRSKAQQLNDVKKKIKMVAGIRWSCHLLSVHLMQFIVADEDI